MDEECCNFEVNKVLCFEKRKVKTRRIGKHKKIINYYQTQSLKMNVVILGKKFDSKIYGECKKDSFIFKK